VQAAVAADGRIRIVYGAAVTDLLAQDGGDGRLAVRGVRYRARASLETESNPLSAIAGVQPAALDQPRPPPPLSLTSRMHRGLGGFARERF